MKIRGESQRNPDQPHFIDKTDESIICGDNKNDDYQNKSGTKKEAQNNQAPC